MRKEDLSYQGKIDELVLDMSHPRSQGKVFILVEGESHLKVFRKLCNDDSTKIEEIPGGKLKLIEGLNTLCTNYKLTIAICDADFYHISSTQLINSDNLFFTDVHDIELLMASHDNTFSAVVYEFHSNATIEHNDLRIKLLEMISYIGYCRWHNDEENKELKGLNDEENI